MLNSEWLNISCKILKKCYTLKTLTVRMVAWTLDNGIFTMGAVVRCQHVFCWSRFGHKQIKILLDIFSRYCQHLVNNKSRFRGFCFWQTWDQELMRRPLNHLIKYSIWNVYSKCSLQLGIFGAKIEIYLLIKVNQTLMRLESECDEYIQICKYSNIFYPNFIRIFVRIIFWIQIYSDTRTCQFLGYKYIFGYSFVPRFWYEYIRIFVRINFQIPMMFLFNFYGYYTLLREAFLWEKR